MRDFVTSLLTMAVQGSLIALAAFAVRFLLKKLRAPAFLRVLLWAAVAVRLLVPALPKTTVSVMPKQSMISEYVQAAVPAETAIPAQPAESSSGEAVSAPAEAAPTENAAAGPSLAPGQILFFVWAAGAAGMLTWGLVSFLRLKHKVKISVKAEKNVYLCDAVYSPFLLGLFTPRIYVPSSLSGEALQNVLAHERAHIKRGDHLIKPLGFLLLSAYWFNPLFWAAYVLLCRDIEFACDEKVLKTMDRARVAEYSETLLSFHARGRAVAACPVAFGEVGVKQRVKAALSYKKPAFWVLLAAALAGVCLCVFFLTDRTSDLAKLFPPEEEAIKAAVAAAMTDGEKVQAEGIAEGHVLLGLAEKDGVTEAYAYCALSGLGFENGVLTSCGTGGYTGPRTFLLKPAGSGYTCTGVLKPEDGEGYEASVAKIMPATLWRKAQSNMESISAEIKAQKTACAEAYLASIGREADIELDRWNLRYTLLTRAGVPLSVAEAIDRNPSFASYPDFVGSRELVTDGIRYVFETAVDEKNGRIVFTKRINTGTPALLGRTVLDLSTGRVLDSLQYDDLPMTYPQEIDHGPYGENNIAYSSKAQGDLNGNGVPDTLYLCHGDGFYLLAVENGSAFACDLYKTNGDEYALALTDDPEYPVHLQAHYFTEDGIMNLDTPVIYRQGEEYNPGMFHPELYVAPAEDGYPNHFGAYLSYDAARLLVGPMEYTLMGQLEIADAEATVRLTVENADATGATLRYDLAFWGAPSKTDITYGVGYKLQKFSGGRWVDLPMTDDNFAFTTESHTLTADESGTVEARWAQGYGTLPYNDFGECYRVLAPIGCAVNGRPHSGLTIAAPFVLELYYNR